MTTAQIKALAANRAAAENMFTWNNGGDSFTLKEFAEGMEPDSYTTLTADGLNEQGQDDFTDGFFAAAPLGYDFESDCQSETPWCAPWHWAGKDDWFSPDTRTPYEMGKAWAEKHFEEIEEFFSEND
jgi:hypothetical protein